MTITIDKPGSPASGKAFRVSGSFSPHYTAPPQLQYCDDPKTPGKVSDVTAEAEPMAILVQWQAPTTGTVWHPLPSPSSVTRGLFWFQHPGLTPGHHTVVVTDGKTEGSVGFGVQNAAHIRVNPFR